MPLPSLDELFDLRTLMLGQGLLLIATGPCLLFAARLMRQFRALPLWAAVFLLQGAGFVLSCLRGYIDPAIAVFGSNLLLFAGQTLVPLALSRDLDQPFPLGRLGLLQGLLVLLFCHAYWIDPWTALRTVAATGFGAVSLLSGARIVYRHLHGPDASQASSGMLLTLFAIGAMSLCGMLMALHQTFFLPRPIESFPGAVMWSEGNPRLVLTIILSLCSMGLAFSVILHVALRLNRELSHQAHHDGLTGLYNRPMFEELAQAALARHQRSHEPCALLFLDLDHFKHINDAHGHAAGDHVLRCFAALLRRELRRSDIIARFGGEEFCVLLPATSASDARLIAERLVTATRAMLPAWESASIPLSTSIGLALRKDPLCLQTLLAAADKALYAAKRAGRDRVVLAT